MAPSSASVVGMGDQIGTLAVGKLADIVILGGKPFDGYWNMLDAKLTIVGGQIVSDQR